MKSTGLVLFDIDTYKPILITSFQTNDKDTHGVRLGNIKNKTEKIIRKCPPYVVAIERGFARFNTATQVIYRVHGVINELMKNFKQIYYPPKTVKEVITGNGNATKKKVQNKIKEVYPDIEFKNDDESDAFAVGLTYLIKECGMKWNKKREVKK